MRFSLSRSLLALAGGLLLFIGSAVLFQPIAFAAANGIDLPASRSLLSEFRAPGGLLIASGVLMLVGAVRGQFLNEGLALATLVYGTYGVSRLVGAAVDGWPSASLRQAMGLEIAVAIVCAIVLVRRIRGRSPIRSAGALPRSAIGED